MKSMNEVSVYEAVGGLETFRRLAHRFYAEVESDTVLRPLYPANLDAAKEHLALFLAQYFGGPPVYSNRRGHPRLRMRHLRFAIGAVERDAWLRDMQVALDAVVADDRVRMAMQTYFADAADFLINQDASAPQTS
jgi:hemoglobin